MNWYKKAQIENVKFEIKKISELSANEKLALYKLNLGKDIDMMYDNFSCYVQYNKKGEGEESDARIVTAKLNDKILGWALINEPTLEIIDVFVYVSKSYRRMGIGSKLVNMSREYIHNINKKNKQKYVPSYKVHDDTSKKFFESIKNLSPYLEYHIGNKNELV